MFEKLCECLDRDYWHTCRTCPSLHVISPLVGSLCHFLVPHTGHALLPGGIEGLLECYMTIDWWCMRPFATCSHQWPVWTWNETWSVHHVATLTRRGDGKPVSCLTNCSVLAFSTFHSVKVRWVELGQTTASDAAVLSCGDTGRSGNTCLCVSSLQW